LLPVASQLRYVIPTASPPSREDDLPNTSRIAALLQAPPHVINIGLPEFAAELTAAGIAVLQLDWAPPVIADPRIRALLAKLSS